MRCSAGQCRYGYGSPVWCGAVEAVWFGMVVCDAVVAAIYDALRWCGVLCNLPPCELGEDGTRLDWAELG